MGLTTAPRGAPEARLKVSVFAGRSGSLATLVMVSNCPSRTMRLVMAVNAGERLTSLTITVTRPVALRLGKPLSVTRTTRSFVLGPVDSLVGQVRTPVWDSNVTPGGTAPIRLKETVCGG